MNVHHAFVFILALATVAVLAFIPGLALVGPKEVSYADLVTIMLSVITIILGALALGLGALALWGYKEFMTKADDSAKTVAESTANTYLSKPEFRETLRELAREIVLAETKEQAVSGVSTSVTLQPVDPKDASPEPFKDIGDMGAAGH